ncbi:MAG: histidinol dehydrogenase [Cenarchaeum symbiont of Oopsacas minuta]|nr:histidinol dehydrogenase [Cenarchaeum symbiont of Oopsacas minuta]
MIKIIKVSDPEKIRVQRIHKDMKNLENAFAIAKDVSKNGDAAVKKYEKKFAKNPKRLPKVLRVSKKTISKARTQVTKEQLEAIQLAKKYLENTEKKTLSAVQKTITVKNSGVRITRSLEPLKSVGCYVPGGNARYPSSAIMSLVPAKVAGVRRIIVCSPPDETGSIDPLTLTAADICGASEIYSMGGPHAIAAMTYGTKSIMPVDKIVGPGGEYVIAAKQFATMHTNIDMIAGPTELVIAADAYADPSLIAADLRSQAEHGPQSWCALITNSKNIANKVKMN